MNLDCNLACGYCFEEGLRGKHAMSPETADLLVEMIEREQIANGRKVAIDFYGGEPLLSRGLIHSIASRLKRTTEAKGVPFEFSLVTNGTLLTREVALELKVLGMKEAKITLDGPREVHDRSRPFASGKGSFDIIISNILEIMDVIGVQIGGNFTRENYREFPRLLDHLLAVGITPGQGRTRRVQPGDRQGRRRRHPRLRKRLQLHGRGVALRGDRFLKGGDPAPGLPHPQAGTGWLHGGIRQ